MRTPTLAAGPPLILPADFGRRFIIFADAEEEFDWSAPFSRAATQTSAIKALPAATSRLNTAGAAPVYLCDYPVISNPESAAIIQSLSASGQCHIGAQLHPWVTPPFDEDINDINSFSSNLTEELEENKLHRLTNSLTLLTGTHPKVYRAGRYGIRPASFAILSRLGYELDVSIRAGFDYRSDHGPNFLGLPITPWASNDNLTCLPMTTCYAGPFRTWKRLQTVGWLQDHLSKLRLLRRIPLTPEGTSPKDALEAIAILDGEGHQIFSLSFHTPSLVPGHTPYVRNYDDLRAFWNWWDVVLTDLARRGIKAIEYAHLAHALRHSALRSQ